jgi:Domain of unknown function (DUF4142)
MRMIVSTVGVVALLSAIPALAAVSRPDKAFAAEAAYGELAEVQIGQLALQKTASPQVKQFAQRMVTDQLRPTRISSRCPTPRTVSMSKGPAPCEELTLKIAAEAESTAGAASAAAPPSVPVPSSG